MNEHSTSIKTSFGSQGSLSATGATEAGDISITCYEGPIPAFIGAELPARYGDIHSTLAQLRIYGGLDAVTHTYVVRRHGSIVSIFLFRHERNAVRVINEGMAIADDEFDRFAAYVFANWPSVHLISFHAVRAAIQRLAFPCQHYVCTASIVLPLPASAEEYVASLGKNMRRNLRRYMDKLKRDFPSFRFDVFEKERVQAGYVRDIMNLNRARIAGKNKTYAIDDEEEKIIALSRETGMVGVATIDGVVVAGSIGYLVGDHYFFKIIAHDPRYNEYSAGILCCYLTICECIARGCKEYNFMWNEYEYKFALGARPRSLEHVVVYRSRLHFVRHSGTAARIALNRHRHRLSVLLDKADKREDISPGERRAIRLMNGLRNLKRRVRSALPGG